MINSILIPPVPPLIQQPDGYSCGPMAAKMMLDLLKPLNGFSLEDMKFLFLTNPETGTTHEGMICGLDALRLSYTRTDRSEDPFRDLDAALASNKLFIMRTAIQGCKHWILIYGKRGESYLVADPMGRYWTASHETISEIWGCRNWDGFIIDHSFDSEIVEFRKIREDEVSAAITVGHESFKDIIGGSYKELYNSIMWSMVSMDNTWVATYRDKIIGGYFLEYNNINDYCISESYKDKVGLQGVALFLLPEFRGMGIGRVLRNIPLEMPVDYVWGMHYNALNNTDKWVKFGRKQISKNSGMSITLMDLQNKTEPSS